LFEGSAHRFYCIQDAVDGEVVLGTGSLTFADPGNPERPTVLVAPWVAKLDKEGRVLWERMLVSEHEPVLTSPQGNFNPQCTGLQISDDGRITVAVSVTEIADTQSSGGKITLPEHYYQHTKAIGTLVVQLDPDGRDLSTFRTDAADAAFLFAGSVGFSLVEHTKPAFDRSKGLGAGVVGMLAQAYAVINASGVRITSLDDHLRKIGAHETRLPALSNRLSAVLPMAAGEYIVAGCDQDSYNSLAKITSTGSVKAVQRILPSARANQCAEIGLAPGPTEGQLLMFFGNRLLGNNILRVAVAPTM
jgi:hypothetical protein